MVIWVFAGGGETEVKGLIKFLQKHFPNCAFIRLTPFDSTKKGAKPNKKSTFGITGKSLSQNIEERLPLALADNDKICNLILVLDDLDCRNPEPQKEQFQQSILKGLNKFRETSSKNISNLSQDNNINSLIGFAAPEIEAWIIADWDNSMARHEKFRSRQKSMQYWLSTQKKVPFDNPESFSEYDFVKDCCQEKLSELLIKASSQNETDRGKEYKKAVDTPDLLLMINPNIVKQKCPLFYEFYNYLQTFTS